MTQLPYLPSSLPSKQAELPAIDPGAAESAAQQIASSSLTSYGALPNPQAVYEGAMTGGASTISQMAMLGTPEYASQLTGSPAGEALNQQPYSGIPAAAQLQPQTLTSSVMTYDDAAKQQQKDALGQGDNSTWQAFGEVPIANIGYVQSIEGSRDPKYIKKWQSLLQQKGFYGDGNNNHVNGAWNSTTDTAALQGFMVSKFLPDALYGKDPTQQSNASLFLSSLGVDVASMQTKMRDPESQAQVAQQWMAAQGPDDSVSTNRLQAYADAYGEAALPESYQAIIRPDLGRSIRDGLLNLPLIGLLNNVPLLGGGLHGVVNLLTGNLDLGHLMDDPRAVETQTVKKDMTALDKLTPDDLKNMQPVLDQVAADTGFMGFMDGWDHTRNTFLLSVGSTLFTGLSKGDWENPFDPTSASNLWAQAHADSMASAIFGDQWAQDNPTAASMLNLVVNTADDPLSYVNIAGDLKGVQRFNGIRSSARLLGHDDAYKAWNGIVAKNTREMSARGWFNTYRTAYAQQKMPLVDVLTGLDIPTVGSLALSKLQLVQRFMKEPDAAAAWDLFQNGDGTTDGFGHLAQSGRSVYNMRANFHALTQVKEKPGVDVTTTGRLARVPVMHKLNHIRILGGLEEHPDFELLSSPVSAAQSFRNRALAAGMTPGEYGPLIDDFLTTAAGDPNKVLEAGQAIDDAIMEAYHRNTGVTPDMLEKHASNRRQSGHLTQGAGQALGEETTLHAPEPTARTPEAATEVSTTTRARSELPPAVRRQRQDALDRLQTELTVAQSSGMPQEVVSDIQQRISGLQRPTPMFTTQLADSYVPKYTLYEMVTATSKTLRAAEHVQAAVRADALMSMWKRWTIGRISSSFRITLGDDAIRPAILMVASGHPLTGMRYLAMQIARSFGLLIPGMRAKVLARTQMLLDNPDFQRVTTDFAKIMNEVMPHSFGAFIPGRPGYAAAAQHVIENIWAPDPLVKTWLAGFERGGASAARSDLEAFVKQQMKVKGKARVGAQSARVQAWARAQNADLGDKYMKAVLDRWHGYATELFRNDRLREWTQKGKADEQALARLVKNEASLATSTLPTISARQETPFSRNLLTSGVTRFPNLIFEHFTKPMVDSARANGLMAVKDLYARNIREYYKGTPRAMAPDFEQMIDQESTSQALHWMLNNTYQGTRSVLGGALRNVMPFYGATANMDRFYWRQMMAKPAVGVAAAEAAAASQKAQLQGALPGSGMLPSIMFGGGEGLQFNPLHAFFLTSDGVGSMVPGTGPMFSLLWKGISAANPDLANTLATIPGIGTMIDYNTGQGSPLAPTWLGDLLQGGAMAITGNEVSGGSLLGVPIIGKDQSAIESQVNSKIQQMERNKQGSGPGGTVTDADRSSANRQVGLQMLGSGAGQFALPLEPTLTDVGGKKIADQMDTFRQAADDPSKDAAITSALGISSKQWTAALTQQQGSPSVSDLVAENPQSAGALMAYEDQRVSEQQRDAIAAVAPWVVSEGTSKYQYATTQRPTDLQQFDLMSSAGDVRALQPFGTSNSFVSNIGNERQVNAGWLMYEQLKNWEFSMMQQNGWSKTSPGYQLWNQEYMQPALVEMQTQFSKWWGKFGRGGGTSMADLAGASIPLRSLQTWMVIPQHGDFENGQSVLWRNALQFRDQAASAIYELNLSGGSDTERQMVMTQLQQSLQQLAALNPTFAEELGATRFGTWEDVVNLQAGEQQANLYAGSVPEFS